MSGLHGQSCPDIGVSGSRKCSCLMLPDMLKTTQYGLYWRDIRRKVAFQMMATTSHYKIDSNYGAALMRFITNWAKKRVVCRDFLIPDVPQSYTPDYCYSTYFQYRNRFLGPTGPEKIRPRYPQCTHGGAARVYTCSTVVSENPCFGV